MTLISVCVSARLFCCCVVCCCAGAVTSCGGGGGGGGGARSDSTHSDSLFYILSPKDIVVARSRDTDDHISWLLARARYAQALALAQAHKQSLRVHKLLDVGERYLKWLVSCGEHEKAARSCPELLMGVSELWEAWIEVCPSVTALCLALLCFATAERRGRQERESWERAYLTLLLCANALGVCKERPPQTHRPIHPHFQPQTQRRNVCVPTHSTYTHLPLR